MHSVDKNICAARSHAYTKPQTLPVTSTSIIISSPE
jgi:hypothetical protein